MKFDIPSHTHTILNGDKATPHRPYYTLKKLWSHGWCKHCWVNKGIHTPQHNSVCLNMILGLSQTSYNKTIRVSCRSKSSLWGLRRALHTQHKGLKTKSKPWVSLSIQSWRFFRAHTMTYVAPQHPFFPASQVFCMLQQFVFFTSMRFFNFPQKHTDAPIVGVSDIGQVSAYTRKLYKLPPGTSKRPSSSCTKQRKYKKS
jgi:hypothetical protein